ncbi:ATP-dependent DNA helicase [Heracleum sosnowskyi]|uniref:ATP-dependent DNA helicase n=1 Tax=Heracleum sosnowskyi TaxID=360622 RepID=A0AAD8LZ67_9APIA|nr:ATP-dependent DNA helicase [Heracleum sosnowskyi]
MPFGKADNKSSKQREMISMKEYYSYKFQVRTNEGITPCLGGRLYQHPVWDEVIQMMKLLPQCSPPNSPDVMARVFRLKLDQLIDDIKKESYFGNCLGVMYVVEFQKRGYAVVKAFMMHGPCGQQFPKSPCMKQYKCTRHFPKKYCPATVFDQSGFPIYKRRNTNITVKKGNANLDNQWVVPYNRNLLVKYQCHMNVEICAHARSLKYLFKYCLKGHDRATVEIRGKKRRSETGEKTEEPEDEIQSFFDGRYICGCEAAYRIFGFNIHYRSLSVERLSFHLDGNKQCAFRSNEPLPKVASREKEKYSQLEAYFILNKNDSNARKFLYDEIPQHYVWNDADRIWNLRKRGKKIGRLSYSHHSAGELWYLRLLLTKVRGATSFESLRTVKGKVFNTFQEACKEYGLLDDDKEWHQVLEQCSVSGFPPQIRQLFVHIMVNCKVTDLNALWNNHWKCMVDDMLMKQKKLTGNPHLILNEKQQQFYALAEIHNLLKSIGKSLQDYSQMPQPPHSYLDCGINNLIIEETII